MPGTESGTEMLFGVYHQYYIPCGICVLVLYFVLIAQGQKVLKIASYLLRNRNNHTDTPLIELTNCVLYTVLGTFVAVIIVQPMSYQQSAIAGLGFMHLVNSFVTQKLTRSSL